MLRGVPRERAQSQDVVHGVVHGWCQGEGGLRWQLSVEGVGERAAAVHCSARQEEIAMVADGRRCGPRLSALSRQLRRSSDYYLYIQTRYLLVTTTCS